MPVQVDGVPGAMAACKGRLLVGVDNLLRLYDMGEPRGAQARSTRWSHASHGMCMVLLPCTGLWGHV
jgi:hypothetical protein